MVMVPPSDWETSLHNAYQSLSWLRPGEENCQLLSLIYIPDTALMKKLHCARPIPGNGCDHTLFHQGVSVASFHILFEQWFLCVNS